MKNRKAFITGISSTYLKKKEINFLGGSAYIANLCSSFVKDIKIISFLMCFID